jgi:hypothetical protein
MGRTLTGSGEKQQSPRSAARRLRSRVGVSHIGVEKPRSDRLEFAGDTFDTGVCHMAFFSDPDGNDLMLHHRYAPYA